MYPRITKVKAVENYNLLVTFDNDITKLYNCGNLLNLPEFNLFNDVLFFNSVQVDSGGYGIFWNDDIDISEYELWTNSKIYNDNKTINCP